MSAAASSAAPVAAAGSGLINWALAESVAVRVAGREPLTDSYHYDSLGPDFEELCVTAERLVEAETGLRSAAGPARARVVDRAGWIRANLASFERLLRPVTERFSERLPAQSVAVPVMRNIAAIEVGSLLGWMSTRVLGQYDLLIVEDEHPDEQDLVYFVGPNILALEKRHAFAPRDFRLWLALHEVTHRAQFTGVPWLRPLFLELVDSTLRSLDPDPRRLLHAVRFAAESLRAGRNPLDDGLVALFATPDQRQTLDRVGGLMSLLEGHGDVTMDRAGAGLVVGAEHFSRVLRARRAQGRPLARLGRKLIGIEAKLSQYTQGEEFIARVEELRGPEQIAAIWADQLLLPSLAEIRAPDTWLERVAG